MDDKQQRKSVTGVALLIVGAVCAVIVTIAYNAITEKRAYEAMQHAGSTVSAVSAPASTAPASAAR
jgi:hypothetical protein